jgi:hypothetical protein
LEYSGRTGTFVTAFVASGNGLSTPEGLVFGPNGNLFVTSDGSLSGSQVLEYDGRTGVFISAFVTPDSGGLLTAA